MILLPAVDIRGGRCVRLAQGDFGRETVYGDDPVAVAKGFESAGARWLHVVDLDAALEGVPRNRDVVASVIGSVSIPVQASGGMRSLDAIETALKAGAERVVIGTQALLDKAFLIVATGRFGDAVAVGLDVRGRRLQARGWTEDAGELDETLARLGDTGVQRYVVTDVTRDGMLQGPNLDLLGHVMAKTDAPVIASGGVTSLGDLTSLAALGCEGAIVGKAIYAGAFTVPQALDVAGG